MNALTAAMIALEENPPKQGIRGVAGEDGKDGKDGKDGHDGTKGDPGQVGPVGPVGPEGVPGIQGERGPVGPKGPKGDKGDDGPPGKRGKPGKDGAPGPGPVWFGGGGGGGGGGSQTALTVPFTPAGSIAATNVQAAIEEVAAEGGGSGDLLGAPTTLEIVAGVIDVTGLHYVLLDGEGSADDDLEEITGGVDGQFLILESVGPTIVITYSPTIDLVDQEAYNISLGEFVSQVSAVYSSANAAWAVSSVQVHRSIMSADGNTELIALDTEMQALVASQPSFGASALGFRANVGFRMVGAITAIDPAELGAGDIAFSVDPTAGAPTLNGLMRDANGDLFSFAIPGTPV